MNCIGLCAHLFTVPVGSNGSFHGTRIYAQYHPILERHPTMVIPALVYLGNVKPESAKNWFLSSFFMSLMPSESSRY